MALSDEDRAAIRVVRRFLDEASPGDLGERAAWERVLKLAGEESPEPANGTFWFDPEENDVYMRDDKAVTFGFDLCRWYRTGSEENFPWTEVCRVSPVLVELVRKDSAGAVVDEMYAAAEALHVKLHGSTPRTMFTCTAPECRFARDTALRYGLIAARWSR